MKVELIKKLAHNGLVYSSVVVFGKRICPLRFYFLDFYNILLVEWPQLRINAVELTPYG